MNCYNGSKFIIYLCCLIMFKFFGVDDYCGFMFMMCDGDRVFCYCIFQDFG